MELNSNAEKQARYRKKEQLRRQADHLLRNWQLQPWLHHSRSFHDAQCLVTKAIELPSGWIDEDYQIAEVKLKQVEVELFWSVNQISNDVRENRNFSAEFIQTPDPFKLGAELDRAIENTTALASHIISALKLSACNEADQAAALMEAMRLVGRTLAMSRDIPCSEATTMCLATIGPQYIRPDSFAEKLASLLLKQLDKKLSSEVGDQLIKQSNKGML
jgi:hypothetical protein